MIEFTRLLSALVSLFFYHRMYESMIQIPIENANHRGRVFGSKVSLSRNYINCDFRQAIMNGVTFSGTFVGCNFNNAELRYVHITKCVFIDCSFVGANFREGQLRATSFDSCEFLGASMFGMAGVSTCKFTLSCLGLMGMASDLKVKALGHKNRFSVLPKNFLMGTPSASTSPTGESINLTDYEPITARYPLRKPSESVLPRELRPVEDRLVDPTFLPAVDHYRSAPVQIPESKKPKKTSFTADIDDDDVYYGGYLMGHGATNYSYIANEKYTYGYQHNAVLECSDLEEYTQCQE